MFVAVAIAGCGRIDFDPLGGVSGAVHQKLALDRYDPGEVLVDFPLCVVLGAGNVDTTAIAPDGSDIRIYDDATGASLPVEIEQGGPPIIAWTRVPRIEGTTTTLTLAYGDASVPAATGSVWADSYVAVWHLNVDVHDSTAHHHDGMSVGSTAAPGFRGGGRAFVYADRDYVYIPDGPDFALSTFTLEALVNVHAELEGAGYSGVVTREYMANDQDDFFLGVLNGELYTDVTNAVQSYTVAAGTIPHDQWHAIVETYDGTTMLGYIDQALAVTWPAAGGAAFRSPNPVILGANRNNYDATNAAADADGDFLEGSIDEVRIENVVRDQAWISASGISTGDAWITYGPPER